MRFKKVYVEITNLCNLNCSFCIKNSRPLKNISIDEFKHVLDEIKPYTKYIYLHVLGEPLLHPHLKELLNIAYELGFYVNITTNGTLLKKSLPILLESKAIRQINVSIHSFPDIQDYLKNVCEYCDELSNKNIYISYRLWTMSNELDKSCEETLHYLESRYNKKILFYKNSFKLKDYCFVSFDSPFEWPDISNEFVSDRGSCYGFRDMCAILVDGSVVPCCLDSKGQATLGNIYKESFSDILKNNEELLDDFRRHKMTLEICKHCSYRTRFDHN